MFINLLTYKLVFGLLKVNASTITVIKFFPKGIFLKDLVLDQVISRLGHQIGLSNEDAICHKFIAG